MLMSILTVAYTCKMSSHVNPDVSMGFALKRLQQALRGAMDEALSAHGLSTPQYLVLALVEEHPGATNADLARRSYVAAPTMVRLVEALRGAELIARVDTAGRRRGYELTRDGGERLEKASADVARFEDLLMAEASPDHVEVVMGWLRSCAVRVGQLRQLSP